MNGFLLKSTLMTAILCAASFCFASEAKAPAKKTHQAHSAAGCMACHQGATGSAPSK